MLCGRGTDDAGWPGIAHTAGIDPSPYGGHTKTIFLNLLRRVHTTFIITVIELQSYCLKVKCSFQISRSQDSLSVCQFCAKIFSNFYWLKRPYAIGVFCARDRHLSVPKNFLSLGGGGPHWGPPRGNF